MNEKTAKKEETLTCPCTGENCKDSKIFPNNCLGCIPMDNYFLELAKDAKTA